MKAQQNQNGFASLALMLGSAGLVASIAVIGLVDIIGPLITIAARGLALL
ncbi:MAG: hypothetical protein ACRBC3_08930 [Burkholderiaceae bacterium]